MSFVLLPNIIVNLSKRESFRVLKLWGHESHKFLSVKSLNLYHDAYIWKFWNPKNLSTLKILRKWKYPKTLKTKSGFSLQHYAFFVLILNISNNVKYIELKRETARPEESLYDECIVLCKLRFARNWLEFVWL